MHSLSFKSTCYSLLRFVRYSDSWLVLRKLLAFSSTYDTARLQIKLFQKTYDRRQHQDSIDISKAALGLFLSVEIHS